MNDLTLFSIAVTLFLIMDPVGNIAPYLTLVQKIEPKKRFWFLLREMSIVLAVMLIFNAIGEYLFLLLGISSVTITLASGVILFIVALQILFPTTSSWRAHLEEEKPFVIPLAIPLIAGPSLLATIMLYADLEPSLSDMFFGILFAVIATFLVLLCAPLLNRYLGKNGLLALEKLMGMTLFIMAVQRISEGVNLFLS